MTERYTILRELGRGAIGTVYAARDRSTGAVVALKTLDPALFQESGAELAELFLKNARAATTLRHRNIVRTFDAGEAGGTAYVAMELVEGESLRRMLDERPLPLARAIQIFDDIASALAYAHEEKVVHRGVRPSNILVSGSGVAKLGDFGTGQIGEAARRYLSPEQARRDALDHRSDLFSLGAVFYEMLTQRSPFEADSPPPSKVNPHVPGALDALVSRLLAPLPDDRFASARDLLRELQRLEDAIGLRPGGTVAAAAPEPRPPAAEDAEHRIPILVDEPFEAREATFMEDRGLRPEPSPGSRIASTLSALALALAGLSIGLTVALHYSPDLIERLAVAIRTQDAPTPAPVVAPAPPPAPEPIQKVAARETAPPAAPEPVPPVPLAREPEETAPAQKAPRAKKGIAKVPEPQPAKLIVAVSPRGELYIDDEHHGTTPPLRTLDLEPGMHRIEIRSGSRKPYVTYVTLKAGDERRIRHDFSAKPVRVPR
jgi:eukaryotic-like serine/threonine-protein kinase